MKDRSTQITPATTHDERIRLCLAIELSKKSWDVLVCSPVAAKLSRYRSPAGDGASLLTLIARLRTKAEARLGKPIEVVSCYEAGYDGFWLHRLLMAHGIDNKVFDPASLQVSRRARPAKTDRIDGERLLRALLAHLRGEPRVISVVRVPSIADEDARRLHRERSRLVAERVQHVNRIKGLCATQGIYDFEPLRRDRTERLASLRTGDGRVLPDRLKAEIEREIKRLELVLMMIANIEKERDAILDETKAADHPNAAKIQALAKFKGIAAEFSSVLVGEVYYKDFDNRRQVGSYVGLAPSPFASGAMQRDQGISKAGNPKARTSAIEFAWMWLRHQPASALSIWFRERVGSLKGRPRRIAIVALARKLLVALWRYLETGLVPQGAVLKA
jgi:transposase